jgi:hypothetical protein
MSPRIELPIQFKRYCIKMPGGLQNTVLNVQKTHFQGKVEGKFMGAYVKNTKSASASYILYHGKFEKKHHTINLHNICAT